MGKHNDGNRPLDEDYQPTEEDLERERARDAEFDMKAGDYN